MKNAILLAKNQEYVSHKCEKSYFSTKYRISAQNRICPRSISLLKDHFLYQTFFRISRK